MLKRSHNQDNSRAFNWRNATFWISYHKELMWLWVTFSRHIFRVSQWEFSQCQLYHLRWLLWYRNYVIKHHIANIWDIYFTDVNATIGGECDDENQYNDSENSNLNYKLIYRATTWRNLSVFSVLKFPKDKSTFYVDWQRIFINVHQSTKQTFSCNRYHFCWIDITLPRREYGIKDLEISYWKFVMCA